MLNYLEPLRVFHTIAMNKGVNAAAKFLHLTPSAVSQSLKHLETELGLTLARRSRAGFQLTPEGSKLYACCQRIHDDLENVITGFTGEKNEMGGNLKITMDIIMDAMFGAKLLLHLQKKFPRLLAGC